MIHATTFTKHSLTLLAQGLKLEILKRRPDAKATLLDLKLLIACKSKGEYELMFNTKLYVQHGGEYCEYLQILS